MPQLIVVPHIIVMLGFSLSTLGSSQFGHWVVCSGFRMWNTIGFSPCVAHTYLCIEMIEQVDEKADNSKVVFGPTRMCFPTEKWVWIISGEIIEETLSKANGVQEPLSSFVRVGPASWEKGNSPFSPGASSISLYIRSFPSSTLCTSKNETHD